MKSSGYLSVRSTTLYLFWLQAVSDRVSQTVRPLGEVSHPTDVSGGQHPTCCDYRVAAAVCHKALVDHSS